MPTFKPPGDGDRTFELATITGDLSTRTTVSLLWDGGALTLPLPERDPCVIGRAADADLSIDARSVSRRHAQLHQAGGLSIEDLGSANGTRVRGRTLAAGERVPVEPFEPVMIGSVVMIVRPNGGARGEASARGPARMAEASAGPASQPRSSAPEASPADDVELLISVVAPTDLSVLLLGETGVGKSYFARAIHERSKRAGKPLVHLNCAALQENLLESELFGHERGAFSGAAQAKPGLFESAEGGTVFLDEIGELPAAVQAKLLVAIERREVLRVGGLKPRPIDVRFISATNRPNSEQAIVGLRPDLYFRLAGLPICVPPLRERQKEIPALAEAFVRDAAKRLGRPVPAIAPSALAALSTHSWPGNVRELASVLDRALLFCKDTLLPSDLRLPNAVKAAAPPAAAEAHVAAETQPRIEPAPSSASHVAAASPAPMASPAAAANPAPSASPAEVRAEVPAPAPQRTLSAEYQELERRRIIEALEACGGNQSRAATVLGISRKTLVTRIGEFGLPRPRKR